MSLLLFPSHTLSLSILGSPHTTWPSMNLCITHAPNRLYQTWGKFQASSHKATLAALCLQNTFQRNTLLQGTTLEHKGHRDTPTAHPTGKDRPTDSLRDLAARWRGTECDGRGSPTRPAQAKAQTSLTGLLRRRDPSSHHIHKPHQRSAAR